MITIDKIDGNLIKEYRKKKMLSQADLAKMLFVEQSTISRWETGQFPIPVDMQEKIYDCLEMEKEDCVIPDPSVQPCAASPKPCGLWRTRIISFSFGVLAALLITASIWGIRVLLPRHRVITMSSSGITFDLSDGSYMWDELSQSDIYNLPCVVSDRTVDPLHKIIFTYNQFLEWISVETPPENVSLFRVTFYQNPDDLNNELPTNDIYNITIPEGFKCKD